MDFELPKEITEKLAELDAFIEAEIKPLECDNIQYFVAGLVAAILLLLLVVSITQRRSKEKAKGETAKSPASPGAPGAPASVLYHAATAIRL